MQSFADLMLVSIITVAVMLLVLILVSFILTSRRINHLEVENEKLMVLVNAQNASIDELRTDLMTLTKRFASNDKSLRFVNQNIESIIDKQEQMQVKMQDIEQKQEQDKNLILQSLPENQSTNDAIRLLKQGMPLDEVAMRTSIPKNELEMLSAVHSINVNTAPLNADNTAQVESNMVKEQLSQQMPAFAPQNKPVHSNHIASLRARNAYGIGNTLKKR